MDEKARERAVGERERERDRETASDRDATTPAHVDALEERGAAGQAPAAPVHDWRTQEGGLDDATSHDAGAPSAAEGQRGRDAEEEASLRAQAEAGTAPVRRS